MEPRSYYSNRLKNPLLAGLSELPEGEALKKSIGYLPPVPDEAVRGWPAERRLALLSELRRIHVPLGRDVQLAGLVFDLVRDGYSSRNPTPARIARRKAQVDSFLAGVLEGNAAADYEAIGGALIGISGSGKTRLLKRLLRLIPQVVECDVAANPLLPAKVVRWICVECPSNRKQSALVDSIFSALEKAIEEKIPNALKIGNKSELIQHIGQLAIDYCLGILVVDEIQHVLRGDGRPEPEVLNFLVELSNKLEIPILIVGTPLAQKVVGGQLRQARRMLGPAWANFGKQSKSWSDFIDGLWPYQFTRQVTPFKKVEDKFYELTQGVPALAVSLFRFAQRYVIMMASEGGSRRKASTSKEEITVDILQAVYDDFFQVVDPMVKALASGDHDRIAAYEDLKLDAQAIEDELLRSHAQYREQLRIKFLKEIARAHKKAARDIKSSVVRQTRTHIEKPVVPATTDPALLKAYKKAVSAGKDPGEAVADAAT